MLRVSSYRRLFEEEQWGSLQHRSSVSGGEAEYQWGEPDFKAARALNREALARFKAERALIAGLNDRLALLIDTARCLEEENESLEAQILELEGRLSSQDIRTSARLPDCGLEAAVERLRREKEQILADIDKLKKELGLLQDKYDEAAERRTLITLEREDVALDVDTLTAECLALKEQVAIYEEQLAKLQVEQETTVESVAEPAVAVPLVTLEFSSPDVTPAILDIKEYFRQLAATLQLKATAAIAAGQPREGESAGARLTDGSKAMELDLDGLMKQVADLQKELEELEEYYEELKEKIRQRKADHLEEIEELEGYMEELRLAQMELQAQMREQCGDYDELLNEKMALDIEITAYRGLVEEEEERLHFL